MARSAVLAGRTIADLVRNVFVVLLMVVVGLLVGFRVHTNSSGFARRHRLVLLLFGFALAWVFAHHRPVDRPTPRRAQAASFPILASSCSPRRRSCSPDDDAAAGCSGSPSTSRCRSPSTPCAACCIGGPTADVGGQVDGLERRHHRRVRADRRAQVPPRRLNAPRAGTGPLGFTPLARTHRSGSRRRPPRSRRRPHHGGQRRRRARPPVAHRARGDGEVRRHLADVQPPSSDRPAWRGRADHTPDAAATATPGELGGGVGRRS